MQHEAIDLRSDTLPRPSQEMLEAMAAADGGDDCFGEQHHSGRSGRVLGRDARQGRRAAHAVRVHE
jgi:hypothetical protein